MKGNIETFNILYFSSPFQCKGNCFYCFAKTDEYKNEMHPLFKKTAFYKMLKSGVNIVYPFCNTDINFIPYSVLENILADIISIAVKERTRLIVSLSTKYLLSERKIRLLSEVNQELQNNHLGFLKVSISLSNKNHIEELEPFTSSFKDRITNAHLLKRYNIPCFLLIKPILPNIPLKEYLEILKEFRSIVNNYVVLGYLYILHGFKTNKKFIVNLKKEITHVSWLSKNVKWPQYKDISKYKAIKDYARNLGYKVFDSDKFAILNFYNIKEIQEG